MADWSKTWTWVDGEWLEGNPPLMGPRTHAAWLASSVFDGARAFDGVMPDLDLHAQRINASAGALGLSATMQWEQIAELTKEGMGKFERDEAVYIKPMYWAEEDGPTVIDGAADSTRFCLCLFAAPMPPKDKAISLTLSPFRRPTMETMPVNAKAGCLYPNNARASVEAKKRGFDNAIMRDTLGNVAELTSANVFMVKDGDVHTPFWNGTFLNGITRQRTIQLLRDAGYEVYERTLSFQDFQEADEIFSTGNYSKVVPANRLDDREMEPGPVSKRAQELYFEYAAKSPFTY